jgi:excisionase family DNA binding protein
MMPGRSLVSISEASRTLGVSEATLRLWTDEGRIRAFVTPGGHRRYSKNDLRRFTGLQGKVHGMKDLGIEIEEASGLQHQITETVFPATIRHDKLSQESRQKLAGYGRRMLNVILGYITQPGKRDETIRLAHEVGRDFGSELAGLGIPLSDAVEAFLLHRAPFVDAITNLMKRREMLSERTVEAVPMITRVIDEALLALVAAYHEAGWGSTHANGESVVT